MKFTFGIIAAPGAGEMLQQVTDSICDEQIPDFEIIVVGGNVWYESDVMRVLPFDETKKDKWITRKKNIITENARYDNIVYLHDYVALTHGWFKGMEEFGENFDVCMTKIVNADGTRYRDWTLWPHDITPDGSANLKCLLPYDVGGLSKLMYISGTYWIAKKKFMQQYPLDEKFAWGEGEDVEWSKRVREHCTFSINERSAVKLLRQKDRVFNEIDPELLKKLQETYANT